MDAGRGGHPSGHLELGPSGGNQKRSRVWVGGFMLGCTDLQEPGLICWPSAQRRHRPPSPASGTAGQGLQSSLCITGFICELQMTTPTPCDFCEGYRK